MDNTKKLQEAVNVMALVVTENAKLRKALSDAKSHMSIIHEGISPHAYRQAYETAKPVKFSTIVADAINAIDKALS